MNSRAAERARLGALALIAIHAVTLGAMAASLAGGTPPQGDVLRYFEIARAHASERVEYPPLAVGAMEVLGNWGLTAMAVALVAATALADATIAIVLKRMRSNGAAMVYLALSAPLLAYLVQGYDLVVAAVALVALICAQRGRQVAAGLLLGAAVFLKLWPALLVIPLWIAGRRVAAAVQAGAAAAAGAVWVAVSGIRGPLDVATFRGARGWHIESTPGNLFAIVTGERARKEAGAFRVGAPPSAIGALLLVASAAVIALIARRAARRSIGATAASMLAALMAGATLLSPQYLAWILPFAALAWADGEKRTVWLTAAAVAATTALLALTDLTQPNGAPSYAIVLVRNAALIALAFAPLAGRSLPAAVVAEPLGLGRRVDLGQVVDRTGGHHLRVDDHA